MKTSCRHLASGALLVLAGLSFGSVPAVAAANASIPRGTISQGVRSQLTTAFSAAREFRPRGERSLYELGRADAETAMRAADALVSTRAERLLAGDIHSYFAARDACRTASTVNEYGTCEAHVSESLGEKINQSLGQTSGR